MRIPNLVDVFGWGALMSPWDSRYPVSEHITEEEYQCPHCHKYPPDLFQFHELYQELFDVFEHLRRRWNEPPYPGGGLTVTSGYRCPAHNLAIGGSPGSPHMAGLALDIQLENKTQADQLHGIVERDRPDVRIGRYISKPGLVHIDVAYLARPRLTDAWARGVRWINP